MTINPSNRLIMGIYGAIINPGNKKIKKKIAVILISYAVFYEKMKFFMKILDSGLKNANLIILILGGRKNEKRKRKFGNLGMPRA